MSMGLVPAAKVTLKAIALAWLTSGNRACFVARQKAFWGGFVPKKFAIDLKK
jgi:hypothetical protein